MNDQAKALIQMEGVKKVFLTDEENESPDKGIGNSADKTELDALVAYLQRAFRSRAAGVVGKRGTQAGLKEESMSRYLLSSTSYT